MSGNHLLILRKCWENFFYFFSKLFKTCLETIISIMQTMLLLNLGINISTLTFNFSMDTKYGYLPKECSCNKLFSFDKRIYQFIRISKLKFATLLEWFKNNTERLRSWKEYNLSGQLLLLLLLLDCNTSQKQRKHY